MTKMTIDSAAIAAQFKAQRESLNHRAFSASTREFCEAEIDNSCERMAALFRKTYSQFPVASFLKACGIENDYLLQCTQNVIDRIRLYRISSEAK